MGLVLTLLQIRRRAWAADAVSRDRVYCTVSNSIGQCLTVMDRFRMHFWMLSEDKPGLSEDD